MHLPTAVDSLSALAHASRLAVFRLLIKAGPEGVSAGDIAREVGALPNTLSTHLAILAHAGLVQSRREGRSIIYTADYARMRDLLGFLMDDCCGGRPEICQSLVPVGVTLSRRVAAELVGTALLLAIVVGSGIMGQRLAGGNAAIALLGNTIATGAGLVVLIELFGPISGAQFNPAVTLVMLLRRAMPVRDAACYVVAQLAGAVAGVWVAHAMFAEPIWQVSTTARDGVGQGLAECVATFGLIGTILGTQRFRPTTTPQAVGLYITAAYWFTASTSFANPAVTVARSLSDTFAGIAPHSVPLFVVAQLAGAVAALAFFGWLLVEERHA